MNNLPRQKLIEIVRRHGQKIITEPRRCEGLMRDHFPTYRREVSVLSAALEQRIPEELLAAGKSLMPRGALLARLAARLHDDVAIEASAARWSVHSWALALDIITTDEVDALERADPQASATETRPVLQKQTRQEPSPMAVPSRPPANPASVTNATLPRFAPSGANPAFVVAPDGSGNFLTLSDAIRSARPGSHLRVRPGIYNESLVLDKPLEITGEGALEEIIVRATTSSCFVMRTDEAVIRNLTLRGQARAVGAVGDGFFAVDIPHGRLLLEGCDISSDSLACVAIHNPAAMPLIRDCHIHHSADSGIFAFDGARGEIEKSNISENSNVGIAITGGASLSVMNCHVHHGADAGIVVWGDQAAAVIEDCDIYANRRADVGVSDAGTAALRRCRIHDGENTGIFTHRNGRATVEGCDIYRHAAPEVAVSSGGDVRLRNCQIHDGQSHGAFIHDRGRALLENCDVFRNLASGIYVDSGGFAVARACRINYNNKVGVSCQAGSMVEVEGCDLTQNRVAGRETNHDAMVSGSNNRF